MKAMAPSEDVHKHSYPPKADDERFFWVEASHGSAEESVPSHDTTTQEVDPTVITSDDRDGPAKGHETPSFFSALQALVTVILPSSPVNAPTQSGDPFGVANSDSAGRIYPSLPSNDPSFSSYRSMPGALGDDESDSDDDVDARSEALSPTPSTTPKEPRGRMTAGALRGRGGPSRTVPSIDSVTEAVRCLDLNASTPQKAAPKAFQSTTAAAKSSVPNELSRARSGISSSTPALTRESTFNTSDSDHITPAIPPLVFSRVGGYETTDASISDNRSEGSDVTVRPRTTVLYPKSSTSNAAEGTASSPSVAKPKQLAVCPTPQTTSPAASPAPIHSGIQGVFCVFPDHPVQTYIDALPWCAQYEIGRLVASRILTWETLDRQRSSIVTGSNLEAVRSLANLLPEDQKHRVGLQLRVAQAMDEENKLFEEGQGVEMGSADPNDRRFGGKVRFQAVLRCDPATKPPAQPKFVLELKRATVKDPNSCRFTRRFGSDAFLFVSIDGNMPKPYQRLLLEFFSRGIQVMTRVFHAISCKDGTVVCMSNTGRRVPAGLSPDAFFMFFNAYHNALELDSKQTMGKWASRMSLGLSSSVPGPRLLPTNILMIDDIISPAFDGQGSPPSDMIMTDGAGPASAAIFRFLQTRYGVLPPAIQDRAVGAKGMHYRLRDDASDAMQLSLRPSQLKIKYQSVDLEDPSHTTIDVVKFAVLKAPSRLTSQFAVNLAENGVPNKILQDLFCQALQSAVEPFMIVENNPVQLQVAIERLGQVVSHRLAELGKSTHVPKFAEQLDGELLEHPPSFEESALKCLQAGFSPVHNLYLYKLLRNILRKLIESYTKEFKIALPRSVDGLIVPDQEQVLAEDEIFIQLTTPYERPDGKRITVLEGPVLVTRHPCKLPTDVRKVKAVARADVCRKLEHLAGSIVCPTKGKISFASPLGGGDYDGDRVVVIWEPALVENFRNADISIASRPAKVLDCFDSKAETVKEFRDRTDLMSPAAKRREMQRYLLADLNGDYSMQRYSLLHDAAVYGLGAFDEASIDLAHKYAILLDSQKTGKTIKPEVIAADSKRFYNYRLPYKPAKTYTYNPPPFMQRASHLSPFILDKFEAIGHELEDKLLKQYDDIKTASIEHEKERELCNPWTDFVKNHGAHSRKVPILKAHVEEAWRRYRGLMMRLGKGNASLLFELDTLEEKNAIRAFFQSGLASLPGVSDDELRKVKASYAYIYDFDNCHGRWKGDFPYEMDHAQMCEIKAKTMGPTVTMTLLNATLMQHSRLLTRSFLDPEFMYG